LAKNRDFTIDVDGRHYSEADGITDYRTHPSEFVFNQTRLRFASTEMRP